ncbi:MAG: hypothetical protein NXI12_07775 [Alphaproteobacteria bacterium]|nr:hypothetical protein [Alphaproteobacteria bacterium]
MRFLTGFAAIGLLAGTYLVCPAALRTSINDTLTPDAQTLVEVREGIDAIMRHLDGPGDMGPDAPVRS